MKLFNVQKKNVARDILEAVDISETIEDANLVVTALLAMTFPKIVITVK